MVAYSNVGVIFGESVHVVMIFFCFGDVPGKSRVVFFPQGGALVLCAGRDESIPAAFFATSRVLTVMLIGKLLHVGVGGTFLRLVTGLVTPALELLLLRHGARFQDWVCHGMPAGVVRVKGVLAFDEDRLTR